MTLTQAADTANDNETSILKDTKPVFVVQCPYTFSRGILRMSLWNTPYGLGIKPSHLYNPFPKRPTFFRRRVQTMPEEMPALLWLTIETWRELAQREPRTPPIPQIMLEVFAELTEMLEQSTHPETKVDP